MPLWLYGDDLGDAAERIAIAMRLNDDATCKAERLHVLEEFHREVGILVGHGQQDNSSRVSGLYKRVRSALLGERPNDDER